jgi:hypothetical protein
MVRLEPDPREPKLPKWAQSELSSLRMAVRSLEVALEEAKGNVPDADTFVLDYFRGNRPLPKGARIGFQLLPEEESWRRTQIQCYLEHGWLQVQGDESLHIQPRASNLVQIRLDRR